MQTYDFIQQQKPWDFNYSVPSYKNNGFIQTFWKYIQACHKRSAEGRKCGCLKQITVSLNSSEHMNRFDCISKENKNLIMRKDKDENYTVNLNSFVCHGCRNMELASNKNV